MTLLSVLSLGWIFGKRLSSSDQKAETMVNAFINPVLFFCSTISPLFPQTSGSSALKTLSCSLAYSMYLRITISSTEVPPLTKSDQLSQFSFLAL